MMIISLFTVTSCGGAQNAGDLSTFEFDTETPVTITFYHTMGESLRAVLDKYIAKFNEIYPNITVEHKQVGGYDDVREQIKTEITVGDQPNIAYCYPDHVALYNLAQAVQTLDSLIAAENVITRKDGTTETLGLTQAQIDNFIDGYYNEGKAYGDDKMYTLPMSKSTEVLYYNKTFFDEHKLTVPTTWDELEAVCQKILEIDPKCIPLGYDSESNWFITMCEQLGSDYTSASGDHYLFNNDTNKQFVKRFREWYQKEYVTTQEIYGAYTSGLFTATTGQRSYMSIGSSAGAKHQRPAADASGNYAFEVGITTIPQVDASNPKVISQGPSLCIFKDANPQEVVASWLFVKYLTTNVNFQAAFADASGYVPVLKSVADHPTYAAKMAQADGFNNITYLSAKVCMAQANAYYTSPAFNGSAKARDEVGSLIQAAFIGDASGGLDALIDKVFQDAINNCNK
jgi:multiple sugar transport system substrate-binding protein